MAPAPGKPARYLLSIIMARRRYALCGETLKKARESLGLSRQQICDMVDMDRMTYAAAEQGRRGFPIARLHMLPRQIALAVAEALVEQLRRELACLVSRAAPLKKGGNREN